MRCCYLHIGTHKTGTSTIQHALALQPQRLAEAGFLFPRTGQLEPDSGQHGLAERTTSPGGKALIEQLLAEIAATPHHIILSSEEFSHMLWSNPLGFQHLVNRLSSVVDKVIVVLYLRRQPDYIESNYLERLKSRLCLDFSTYARMRMQHDLAEFTLDYAKLIGKLDRIQGIELVVRAYDAVRESGVLSDFLDVIGWTAHVRLADVRVNTAQSLVESLKNFCRAQERRALSDAEERVIELIASGLPARPRMDRATRRALVQHYYASNREIAARFGLAALMEEPPPERAFGEWCGLGNEPPPDHDAEPGATLDHLFSRDFVTVLRSLAERFGATEAALAETQTLAKERYTEIEGLRARLDRTDAALAEMQTLAKERYIEIEALRARLNRADAALGAQHRVPLNMSSPSPHGYLKALWAWLRSRF